jgi:hypothetical protein
VTGSVSGAVLSPNSESRGLNALVFGLVGAVSGGVLGLLLHDDAEIPDAKKTEVLDQKVKESSRNFKINSTQSIESGATLPAFVKERLKAVVVEELSEPDFISEDGSLHEPHKIYRIKHQAELIAKPVTEKTNETGQKK